ncbi:hypothetical protein [Halomonas sp. M4R1S46]|uniref:hypothetical protein n=1 Tax=Halomonas sp. M4R1S46 TaxID=2982692 RepID=UPI0021E4280C|nr:hypothetical protein [Halomonas sp. M4R1S46]UYG06239.1 hypothetical protein OCT48_11390 [Halomonas sp. M4R1S46]
MLSHTDIDRVFFSVTNLSDLDDEKLRSVLDENSFAIITGLITEDEILEGKKALRNAFSIDNDKPATGESPESIQKNYQKLSIGGGELREKDLSKCVRTFYNPIFSPDIYGLRNAFRQAAMIRNIVTGFDKDFAIDSVQDGFWTASRVHHYPAGGGHMAEHVDDYVPTVVEKYGVDAYFQPLIVMSQKGDDDSCDYRKGGGYFVIDGERVYYDSFLKMGTIVIYNTKILHGVEEVDPDIAFRQDNLSGRCSGLVTMYRDFSMK